MNTRSKVLVVFAILFLGLLLWLAAGCSDSKVDIAGKPSELENPRFPTRFGAEFVGAFDSYGYGLSSHGVFIVTDTKTGDVFVAIEGCGVTQVKTESRGKTSARVER